MFWLRTAAHNVLRVPSFIMQLEQLTPSSLFSEPDVGDAVVQLVVPDLRALNNVGPFVTVLI